MIKKNQYNQIYKDIPHPYKAVELLGYGSYSSVVKVLDQDANKHYAMKISEKDNVNLLKEKVFLEVLQDIAGVTKILKFISTEKIHAIIMPVYQSTLHEILRLNVKLNLEMVCLLGVNILEILEAVHDRKILHQDLKPENIMINFENFHVIDFGLSKTFFNKLGQHDKDMDINKFCGSPSFASINAHRGKNLSRRDDIESLAYILLLSYFGELPWKFEQKNTLSEKIKNGLKMKTNIDLKDFPRCLKIFFIELRKISFEEKPDYKKFKDILLKEINLKIFKNPSLDLEEAFLKTNAGEDGKEFKDDEILRSCNEGLIEMGKRGAKYFSIE